MTVKDPRASLCHIRTVSGADMTDVEMKCQHVCDEEAALGYLLFKIACSSHFDESRLNLWVCVAMMAFRKMAPEEAHRYLKTGLIP